MTKLLSGQTTLTTAGTEVKLGSGTVNGGVIVKTLSTNTGTMYVGNDGNDAVSSSTGFPLGAGDVMVFDYIDILDNVWVDSSVNGEKVAWSILDQSRGLYK